MSSIITAAQVAERTGADEETSALIASAINQQIETATARLWGDTKTVTEDYDLTGVMWLRNMDVKDVTEIKIGYPNEERTVVDSSSYTWNQYGRVTLSYLPLKVLPPTTNDYVQVKYEYGVPADEVPADLVFAALSLAASNYSYSIEHGGKEVTSERIGSYALIYGGNSGRSGQGAGGDQQLNSREWEVIKSYSKWRV